MKRFLSSLKKHAIILVITCAFASFLLFVLSNFVDLHPNAYVDLIRSIVVVYVVMFVLANLFTSISKKSMFIQSLKSNLNKRKNDEPLRSIAITFTAITLINSIMMIVGIDTPKEGTFAYIHMMIRVLIIVTIMVVLMWKETIQWIRNFSLKGVKNRFLEYSQKYMISSISLLFTLFTVLYCSVVILISSVINPVGGINFYITLLVVLLIITLLTFVLNASKKMSKS